MARRNIIWMIFPFMIPTLVGAQARWPGKRSGHWFGQYKRVVAFVLSEEQKETWEAIQVRFQKQRNEILAKSRNARLDLRQLMRSQRLPDEKALLDKVEEVSGFSQQLQKLRYQQQLELRKLLTDDQWKRLKNLLKRRPYKRRMWGRKGRKMR